MHKPDINRCCCYCSVAQSCPTLCNPLDCIPCPSPSPGAWSNSCPSSRWCHPTISSSVVPFSSCLWSFPASGSFPMSQFFTSGGQSIGISASALSFQWIFRIDFLYNWLVWSCCPRESQVSSPAPQFESISSSVLSLLYGPTLTSVHDYWKNHSFDYMDLVKGIAKKYLGCYILWHDGGFESSFCIGVPLARILSLII